MPAAAGAAATAGSGRATSTGDPARARRDGPGADLSGRRRRRGGRRAHAHARPSRAGSAAGRGGIRTPWLIGGAILALALLIGAVGVYLLLPSATIAVTPRPEPVGPIQIMVVADTTATAPDATGAVVPAKLVTVPVAVDDTFPATGKRVELTKATGTVRFENLDPTSSNRIVAGSLVSTGADVRFRTMVTITVPRAELVGLTIFPARASVKVTAVEGGPDGNVDPNTIDRVPRGENASVPQGHQPRGDDGWRPHRSSRG